MTAAPFPDPATGSPTTASSDVPAESRTGLLVRLWARLRTMFSPRTRRPADILPFRPGIRRIYILPDRFGLLFVTVLLAMLIGSVNYNNNLAFLLTFLLGAMSHVTMHHTHANLTGLRIISVTGHPAFAGDVARFTLAVRAEKAARPALVFRLGDKPDHLPTRLTDLPADVDISLDITVPAPRRGLVTPTPLMVETRYPLGLFRAWFLVHLDVSAVVYPHPVAGDFTASEAPAENEESAGSTAVSGVEDFDGLASYRPGDTFQRVSWKAFSKGQGLQTKVFVGQAGGAVTLDWDRLSGTDTELKLSRLCGMVLKADRMGLRYGLRLPGVDLSPDEGERHKHRCLRHLALFGRPEVGA